MDNAAQPEETIPSSSNTTQLGLPLSEKASASDTITSQQVKELLSNLFSSEIEIRRQAISRLNSVGTPAAKHLVEMLVTNPLDATTLFQVSYGLEEMGKSSVSPLLEALNNIGIFTNPVNITLLENIIDSLIRVNDKSAEPWLVAKIKDINIEIQKLQNPANGDGNKTISSQNQKRIETYQNARLRIHSLLGEMNANAGLDDLLELLGDGRKRVHEDVIETLAKIGDKRALTPLIRLYPLESEISQWAARFIKLTIRDIIRREKVSLSDPIFKELSSDEKNTLQKLFPGVKNNNGK
jgi:hypothetical protein